MYDKDDEMPRLLSNYDEEWADLLQQAATDTGFNVEVRDCAGGRYRDQVGKVSLWTSEPKSTDHGPFHKRFRELRNTP